MLKSTIAYLHVFAATASVTQRDMACPQDSDTVAELTSVPGRVDTRQGSGAGVDYSFSSGASRYSTVQAGPGRVFLTTPISVTCSKISSPKYLSDIGQSELTLTKPTWVF
ncbi:hypothetical protein RRG08_048080 [Elysia crispata]|uniref:Uncharacterized protein n=1 Tax=Elysia crispata TaxID=231223 RepID=A0AAE1B428_9GAST|nr:hypothetical protein RRG08_048080 [Elysia crispata]